MSFETARPGSREAEAFLIRDIGEVLGERQPFESIVDKVFPEPDEPTEPYVQEVIISEGPSTLPRQEGLSHKAQNALTRMGMAVVTYVYQRGIKRRRRQL